MTVNTMLLLARHMTRETRQKPIVFAFDRDRTVRVNQLYKPDTLVPLAWVRHLAHETDHEVWAIGNQTLKGEADIPGIEELAERYYEAGIDRLGEKNQLGPLRVLTRASRAPPTARRGVPGRSGVHRR